MMTNKQFQTLCLTIAVVISLHVQSRMQAVAQEAPQSEQKSASQDFFTFGLSYNQINVGRQYNPARFTPMFSASYSHKFLPWFDVEATANITGRSNANYGLFGEASMTGTLTGDATALFTPFAGQSTGWERLRIGAGISLQSNSVSATAFVPATSGWEIRDVYSTYLQWGAHVKAEYLFPVSSNVDIGLRGQIHIFGAASEHQGNYPLVFTQPYSPQLSFGGFIRFRF